MKWLKRILGSAKLEEPSAKPVEYKGFRIHADPISESGVYRIAARIEKQVDGAELSHQLIRSDTLADHEAAVEASIGKAKQMIDEQGERLFR